MSDSLTVEEKIWANVPFPHDTELSPLSIAIKLVWWHPPVGNISLQTLFQMLFPNAQRHLSAIMYYLLLKLIMTYSKHWTQGQKLWDDNSSSVPFLSWVLGEVDVGLERGEGSLKVFCQHIRKLSVSRNRCHLECKSPSYWLTSSRRNLTFSGILTLRQIIQLHRVIFSTNGLWNPLSLKQATD